LNFRISEKIRFVLSQQAAQVLAVGGAARVPVVIHHAAAREGLAYLRVQIVAIGQHKECEVAAELAVHLAGKHRHRVALACALGVP